VQFVAAYNKTKAPFNGIATADSIQEKLQRLCSQISWRARMTEYDKKVTSCDGCNSF